MDKVVVLGAGPAGLAAGIELAKNGFRPIIVEKDGQVGGLCKTICFKGYRFDLGPHRFFTKYDEVSDLWKSLLENDFTQRRRLTRIYYKEKFFYYPIQPLDVFLTLGFIESFWISLDYIRQKIFPYPKEETFEMWVSNRFGKRLYEMFFRTYTEKVWGIPCDRISAEWARQRIKGVSVSSIMKTAIFGNRDVVRSFVDRFWYPDYGAGQMYDKFREEIEKYGGNVMLGNEVVTLEHEDSYITHVVLRDLKEGCEVNIECDYVISSIPFTDLFGMLKPAVNEDILRAADELRYRSLIEICLILDKRNLFDDNWIYLHDLQIKAGRLHNYKNWSHFMCPNKKHSNIGVEYFCNENDELWNEKDEKLIEIAISDLKNMGFIEDDKEVLAGFVARTPKAYPMYFDNYKENLEVLKDYLRGFGNIEVIGRYGMFRYNNMDHSILSGLYAAKNLIAGRKIYDVWSVNVEEEYHEEEKKR